MSEIINKKVITKELPGQLFLQLDTEDSCKNNEQILYKELLNSYIEAVADCKRVQNNEMTLSEIIEKHSKKISESQIWE